MKSSMRVTVSVILTGSEEIIMLMSGSGVILAGQFAAESL